MFSAGHENHQFIWCILLLEFGIVSPELVSPELRELFNCSTFMSIS